MSSSNVSPERSSLARLLATVSTALLVMFTASALTVAIPPQLLNPIWQLRLTSALINFGPLALIGFFLMPLAAWLDPANRNIARHSRWIQSWGLLAVVGYLLLIPLQGVAVAQGLSVAQRGVERQKAEAQQRVSDLRKAIETARSPQELQERLQVLKSPAISPDNLTLPMPALRQKYLVSLNAVEQQLRQAKPGPAPNQLLKLAQDSVRITISSLAIALAFAAGTKTPGHQTSLLCDWQAKAQQASTAWQKFRLRRRRSR